MLCLQSETIIIKALFFKFCMNFFKYIKRCVKLMLYHSLNRLDAHKRTIILVLFSCIFMFTLFPILCENRNMEELISMYELHVQLKHNIMDNKTCKTFWILEWTILQTMTMYHGCPHKICCTLFNICCKAKTKWKFITLSAKDRQGTYKKCLYLLIQAMMDCLD